MMAKFKTYQMSLELFQSCQKLRLPHYMKDQLQRASLSVCLNISEGNVRTTLKDKRRFMMMAYGSVREAQTILKLSHASREFDLANQIGGCLYNLIRNLNR